MSSKCFLSRCLLASAERGEASPGDTLGEGDPDLGSSLQEKTTNNTKWLDEGVCMSF